VTATIKRPPAAASFGIRVGEVKRAVTLTATATEYYNNNNQPAAMATVTSRSIRISTV